MASPLKLDDEMDARIRRLADTTNRSPQAIVDEAMQQYVEREEEVTRRETDALAALQDYRKSGLHLTAAETEAWLDTWGEEAESTAPQCHK